jgi:hypothetical protein
MPIVSEGIIFINDYQKDSYNENIFMGKKSKNTKLY